MPGPRARLARGPITTLLALTLIVTACGGGETADQEDSTTTTGDGAVTSTTGTMTETSEPTETTAAAESASIEVDPSALPSDPSGYDTWSTDLCSLYTPEQLDSFFLGKGELAVSEPLDGGCRWAVDGLPRSHYVDIVVVADGTDTAFQITGQVDVDGTSVDIAHGPEDLVAIIPTPDGAFLRVLIHGGFDAPPGPLGDYLDEAGTGLAENLVSRF
jgi:hypothetical protein